MNASPAAEERCPRSGLARSIGLFTLVMLVVGGVIGSGIFRKPGVMASQLGSPELLLLAWVIAGVVTLMGTLINAEVAAMIPETGGQYVFFERMYGSFFSYLYGWSILAVIQTGSIAAVAYVFAEYSTQFFSLPNVSPSLAAWYFQVPFIGDIAPFKEFNVKLVAVGMIVLLTGVNYLGVRFGGAVQNFFTIAKLAAMGGLVLFACFTPGLGNGAHFTRDSSTVHPTGMGLFLAMAAALQGAFWAYDGWNKVTYLAGEVKRPQRNLPIGLGFGMVAVMIIYLSMNVAYVWVMPIDEMAQSKLVAADVAEKCFSGGGRWIAAAVMISTFAAANASILTTARIFLSMSLNGVFPKALSHIDPRFQTPGMSLLVQGIWSSVLLFSGTFDTLTDTLIFVSWLFYGASAFGLIVLRYKEPHTPRPYRAPFYPIMSVVFVLFAAVFLTLTIWNDLAAYQAARAAGKPALMNFALGLALVFVGTPIYFYYQKRKARLSASV